MKFSYDKDSDSLYIELSAAVGLDAEEISPGVVADYDATGNIVGLDIENASQHIALSHILVHGFLPKVQLADLPLNQA